MQAKRDHFLDRSKAVGGLEKVVKEGERDWADRQREVDGFRKVNKQLEQVRDGHGHRLRGVQGQLEGLRTGFQLKQVGHVEQTEQLYD